MKRPALLTGSQHPEIAAEKGAYVYFRLDSGAIICIEHEGDSLAVYGGLFEGKVVLSIETAPVRLTVIDFRTTPDFEQMLVSGKIGERTMTDEERQYVQTELDHRTAQWESIKGTAKLSRS